MAMDEPVEHWMPLPDPPSTDAGVTSPAEPQSDPKEMMAVKMDKKFYGTILKAKDCSPVPDDQWILFLAKDNAFAATLPTYLANCKALGADPTQIQMVEQMIQRVIDWRGQHEDLCKTPDALGEVVLQ